MDLIESAQRLGVTVKYTPRIPSKFKNVNSALFGCDPKNNKLYITASFRGKEHQEPEIFLHELMHIILTPPEAHIDSLHEAWILLQFERTFAKQFFSKKDYHKVIGYQAATNLDIWEGEKHFNLLFDVGKELEKTEFWKDGIERCKKLGILDHDGKVTWKLPDWKVDGLDLHDWIL